MVICLCNGNFGSKFGPRAFETFWQLQFGCEMAIFATNLDWPCYSQRGNWVAQAQTLCCFSRCQRGCASTNPKSQIAPRQLGRPGTNPVFFRGAREVVQAQTQRRSDRVANRPQHKCYQRMAASIAHRKSRSPAPIRLLTQQWPWRKLLCWRGGQICFADARGMWGLKKRRAKARALKCV